MQNLSDLINIQGSIRRIFDSRKSTGARHILTRLQLQTDHLVQGHLVLQQHITESICWKQKKSLSRRPYYST
jgi:hypothetical protein